jgi:hypothetical protein
MEGEYTVVRSESSLNLAIICDIPLSAQPTIHPFHFKDGLISIMLMRVEESADQFDLVDPIRRRYPNAAFGRTFGFSLSSQDHANNPHHKHQSNKSWLA